MVSVCALKQWWIRRNFINLFFITTVLHKSTLWLIHNKWRICPAQCAVIDHYIIHFPDLVERDEKTFEHSWLEKKRGPSRTCVRGALAWALDFNSYSVLYLIWDSSISIVTRLWTRHLRNCLVSIRGSNFSLLQNIHTASEAHPAVYSVGARGLSPSAKWSGQEANHSPQSSAKVKNRWSHTSTPPCFYDVHRDSFNSTTVPYCVKLCFWITTCFWKNNE